MRSPYFKARSAPAPCRLRIRRGEHGRWTVTPRRARARRLATITCAGCVLATLCLTVVVTFIR